MPLSERGILFVIDIARSKFFYLPAIVIMKVLLLLIAVYALIFNQASKQIESKRVIELLKEKKGRLENGRFYIKSTDPENAATEAEAGLLRQTGTDRPSLFSPSLLIHREAGTVDPQNSLYPVSRSYSVNSDKRKS